MFTLVNNHAFCERVSVYFNYHCLLESQAEVRRHATLKHGVAAWQLEMRFWFWSVLYLPP